MGISHADAQRIHHPFSATFCLSPLVQPFPYSSSQTLYGNRRGVIERRFVRGDLNVFLCMCLGGVAFGSSSVLFGSYSAKEAQLSSLMPPLSLPPSTLPSLYKVTNLPGTDSKCVILKSYCCLELKHYFK